MSKYSSFIFKKYDFDAAGKQLTLDYSYDDELNFSEVYRFDFDYVDYDPAVLDRAINNLFFMAGVSYYKAYLAPSIDVHYGALDQHHADFFAKTYQRGLGEFFYVNQLDPRHEITFPVTGAMDVLQSSGNGSLVGLGGGKDSLVSIELLREQDDITTWTVGHQLQMQPLVDATGLPHVQVERVWDSQLSELNAVGAYNGHVPISAILACAGTVAAVLRGKRDIVVSNERSADEPTLEYQGVQINHQYSKSSEFEKDFQELLVRDFGDSIRYYSLLRPLSELRIAELFAGMAFEKYKAVFSSCNRAFTKASNEMFWCGECPKCAFVFLILTPFIERQQLEEVFGKNVLLDPALEPTYRQLLGIEGDKPLECIGEIQESRTAMTMAATIYPELLKYQFELNPEYDYRAPGEHSIPSEVYESVADRL